ncbi:MAG TPA: hypothetical protein VMT71_10890 [Syntrophorhabdales bacterium]|nr:hypothetical protein [Syntrophorhabdales bacterium]
MNKDKPNESQASGLSPYGTSEQRRTMARWKHKGSTLQYWTEVPRSLAVMENDLGEVVFIDSDGKAWRGPRFSKANPVPVDQYPPLADDYLMVT